MRRAVRSSNGATRRATGVAAVLCGLLAASSAWGAAGLQVDELRLDAEAVPGVIGRVTVSNPSGEKIAVTMTPRRWRQGLDGRLLPDTRKAGVLKGVAVSARSFSLAPRAKRTIEVKLSRSPAQRYLYAALVARGTASSKKAGLRPSYQIAVALSLRPPRARQRYALQSYNPRVRKRKGGGILLDVIVRNRGNMVAPPTGTFTVKGAGVTRTVKLLGRTGILPAKRVRLPAVAVKGLKPGRYTATVSMQQVAGANGGRASARKRFRIAKGGRVTR